MGRLSDLHCTTVLSRSRPVGVATCVVGMKGPSPTPMKLAWGVAVCGGMHKYSLPGPQLPYRLGEV